MARNRTSTIALAAASIALICAGLVRTFSESDSVTHTPPPGLWSAARPRAPGPRVPAALSERQREQIARLEALGYVEGYQEPSGLESVTLHVPELAYRGLNLLSSGDAPAAVLIDMEGAVRHRWSYEFKDAFPDHPDPEGEFGMRYWRRVHLFENGDVLAIFDDSGLIKLDAQSNLLWAVAGAFHHDLFVDPTGNIYTLVHRSEVVPHLDPIEPTLLDSIVVLDAAGQVLRRVPILEAFKRSRYAEWVLSRPANGDIFHTNTIEILDGAHADSSAIFRKGNALISLRNLHAIAIVDMRRQRVVWASTGPWLMQHQPTLLKNGNLLLFDNLGEEGGSKVIEFDPLTLEIEWRYVGDVENGFSSETGGSNQRLPNGNTLITESNGGRAFEVTRDGRIVWEYHSTVRAGPNDEFVANLCELVRLPSEFPTEWMSQDSLQQRPATSHAPSAGDRAELPGS